MPNLPVPASNYSVFISRVLAMTDHNISVKTRPRTRRLAAGVKVPVKAEKKTIVASKNQAIRYKFFVTIFTSFEKLNLFSLLKKNYLSVATIFVITGIGAKKLFSVSYRFEQLVKGFQFFLSEMTDKTLIIFVYRRVKFRQNPQTFIRNTGNDQAPVICRAFP